MISLPQKSKQIELKKCEYKSTHEGEVRTYSYLEKCRDQLYSKS